MLIADRQWHASVPERLPACLLHDCCEGQNKPLLLPSRSAPNCSSSSHAHTTPIPSTDLQACEMTKTVVQTCPCLGHEKMNGGAEAKLHSFLTSALNGGEWPILLPCYPTTLPQGPRTLLPLPGIKRWTIQPIALSLYLLQYPSSWMCYASSHQKQNNILTLKSVNVPHCPSHWSSTFKNYAEFLGPSPALAESIDMCCCHFMTLHMQLNSDCHS